MSYKRAVFCIFILSVFLTALPLQAKSIITPWIGLQIGELTQDLSIKYGYFPNGGGAFVHYVFVAGPAGQAGIESGDIIVCCG